MVDNLDIEQLIEGMVLGDRAIALPLLNEYDTEDEQASDALAEQARLPILAVRDAVLFPGQILQIQVSREQSIQLIRWVERTGGLFGAVAQRGLEDNYPDRGDLHDVGTTARLIAVAELSNDRIGVTIKGIRRFSLGELVEYEPYLVGVVMPLAKDPRSLGKSAELQVLISSLRENIVTLLRQQGFNPPQSFVERIEQLTSAGYIVNIAASMLNIGLETKQQILELHKLKERALRVLSIQQMELEMLDLRNNLTMKTRQEMDRQQKEYFLQQQIRTFQEELGRGEEEESELDELRKRGAEMKWTEAVADTFARELRKAERLHPQSPDYSVQLQYLHNMLSLPWGIYTEDNFDLKQAERQLNKDHFGLEKVKERILEHLAVLKLKGDMKSPIICLYGPPGVGKTSLGRSIADSLGRKYHRISLGGVHDEAEIRGHRRTYIGAMSGRIIQGLQKVGSSNPVFVLDEIDKLGDSYKGSPESALLEVLDPEQNTTFHDNYLDIDYDLSKVLFIATANNIAQLSQPLRDRMELIEVSGYIAEEKQQIARSYLVPKAKEEHGLGEYDVRISPKALDTIIEEYTRESGVRTLSRRIASVMRKVAWRVASGDAEAKRIDINPKLVREYLGKPTFQREQYQGNEHPGVVVGLAWTSVGGDILFVESSLHSGAEGKLVLTGSLGDVMKESAVLSLDYIRSCATELGIDPESLKGKEIHLHVPEGATPKDGPSAGITMVTSMVSAMTRRKVRAKLAMTGEMTLRGKVLPVGGIKEKILAAKRSGITDIILSTENKRDVEEINELYLQGLSFHYVEHIGEVLAIALTNEKA